MHRRPRASQVMILLKLTEKRLTAPISVTKSSLSEKSESASVDYLIPLGHTNPTILVLTLHLGTQSPATSTAAPRADIPAEAQHSGIQLATK
jgi:hypothetical protein